MDRSMIDAASGGALMDKTPSETFDFEHGETQYDRQSYQTRQFDGQQFGRPQQYRPSPSQGQYAVPRVGFVPNMPASNHNYYQQPRPRYPAPLFQQ
ncbi:hypothetical protein CR513_31515, partial [Mucuna pruriens]